MPALLDVIVAMILGFTIIMIIINANMIVAEGWFAFNGEMLVQQMLISTATLLEGEMRNMGFGVEKDQTSSSGIILFADSTRLRFASDLGRNGVINEIEYRLGDLGEVSFQNEMIRPLYRIVDGENQTTVGLVTEFSFRYFNREGESLSVPMTMPGNVYLIEIEMEVQYPHALYQDPANLGEGMLDEYYATSRWRQTRLSSKNFQTR